MKKLLLSLITLLMVSTAIAQEEIATIAGKKLHRIINTNEYALEKADGTVEIYTEDFTLKLTVSNLPKYTDVLGVSYNYFSLMNRYEIFIRKSFGNPATYSNTLIDNTGLVYSNFNDYYPHAYDNKFIMSMQTESGISYKAYTIGGILNKVIELKGAAAQAYPNPANTVINIPYSADNLEHMTVTNTEGKVMDNALLTPQGNEYQLDVSAYPSGTYLYSTSTTSGKFIKQ